MAFIFNFSDIFCPFFSVACSDGPPVDASAAANFTATGLLHAVRPRFGPVLPSDGTALRLHHVARPHDATNAAVSPVRSLLTAAIRAAVRPTAATVAHATTGVSARADPAAADSTVPRW